MRVTEAKVGLYASLSFGGGALGTWIAAIFGAMVAGRFGLGYLQQDALFAAMLAVFFIPRDKPGVAAHTLTISI